MKHKFLIAVAAFFIAASVQAQSTVDSIAAKYKLLPMPDSFTIEKAFPALGTYTLNNTTDNATNNATDQSGSLTITLDSTNRGIVWVEGLPQGRIKAYLKKSPSTYRILPQKSENGKQIPGGTLIYDTTTNTLNIALGKAYNEEDPAGIFATNTDDNTTATTDATTSAGNNITKAKSKSAASKSKTKVTFYTATKVQPEMVNNTNIDTSNQTSTSTDTTTHQ